MFESSCIHYSCDKSVQTWGGELSVLFLDCTQPHSLIQSNNITNKEIVASKLQGKSRIYHPLLHNVIINDKVYKIGCNVHKINHQH